MTPREHIRQAEKEIATAVHAALSKLKEQIDMDPSDVDVDMIDVTTCGGQRAYVVSTVRLRF
jgi:hypothetical protein